MMPTSMNCPSMDCHDASTLASTSHLSTNYDDALLTGPSINSHDTSMLESRIHPFIDNHDTSTTTHPSIESHSAAAIHPSVAGNTHIPTTIRPSINSHDSGSDVQPFFFASEPTHAGRRRKCRDMSSLSLCLCGVSAQPDSVDSIQCQRAGCETVWVSDPFLLPFKRFWLNLYSIIYNVLGTLMWVQESGLVMHAR
jgi:hypothetical protein